MRHLTYVRRTFSYGRCPSNNEQVCDLCMAAELYDVSDTADAKRIPTNKAPTICYKHDKNLNYSRRNLRIWVKIDAGCATYSLAIVMSLFYSNVISKIKVFN